MGSRARRKLKKKVLWKDLLKRKWDEVNKIPKKQPVSQFKWIA
ncbi:MULTISPECIES: hypothetical protein [Salipaludibacillus]|jgi:hypothetical protein|uniref:Uncharacterized protein n=1 Tax=Salipaludibacillus aurantiacus TaxID=1601833 RepID=A0A1H9TC86_9BACI|nr:MULTISPECIES: hypothetical protein [Salipaludibacillus]SER94940.1 hypothetical protein SAMN05518684_105257 [Salipaludibacillus aurantiacus]